MKGILVPHSPKIPVSHAFGLIKVLNGNGWTEKDLQDFAAGAMPTETLKFVRREAAAALATANIETSNVISIHGAKKLKEIFTEELTRELGHEQHVRNRALKVLRNNWIETIEDLTKWSRMQLLREPNFGDKSLAYVEQVLQTIGIKLAPF